MKFFCQKRNNKQILEEYARCDYVGISTYYVLKRALITQHREYMQIVSADLEDA